MTSHIMLQRSLCSFVALVAACLAIGCQPADEIRSYTVPKEPRSPAVATSRPTEGGEPTDRMLAAIVPDNGQAWFFKVVGPIATLDGQSSKIAEFFTTIRTSDGQRPKWQLPEGWTEEAGNAMRVATIVIPTGDKPLEMSVTSLPWRGTQEDVLNNLNRWRGQLQLPAIVEPQLPEFTREIKTGDATMTVVDLRGRFQGSNMSPPFASRVVTGPDSGAELPHGHPPIDAGPRVSNDAKPNVVAGAVVPHFEVPKPWQPLPAEGMRKAAFSVAEGAKQALVTVIDFTADAGPMIADPLQNVNRWRREVGLADIPKEALADATESIEIGGKPAIFVAAIPDPAKSGEAQADRATLAAMVNDGNRIWFVKMTGDRELVAAQQDEFKSFLTSVRFAAGGGASDGN
jgi:hypothetical protein